MYFIYVFLAIICFRYVFSIFLYNPIIGILIVALYYFAYQSFIKRRIRNNYNRQANQHYQNQQSSYQQSANYEEPLTQVKADPSNVFDAEYSETEIH